MKITKEYLREIIKEAIEEVSGPMARKIKRFSKGIPSGGYHVPRKVEEPGDDWGLPDERVRIKKLEKFTGVPQYKKGVGQFKTNLAPKGYYVEVDHAFGIEMIGPFKTEAEAREAAKEQVGSMKDLNKRIAADLELGKKEEDSE